MDKIYRDAIDNKIANAKKDLLEKYGVVKPNLKEHMDYYLTKGFYGWELMRDPFLWRDECKEIIEQIDKEIQELGYHLFMNSKYHTVTIMPSISFGREVKECFVGFNQDTQFVHYTLDDNNLDTIKKWKSDIEDWKSDIENRITRLEEKVESLWFAPDMPGYNEAEKKFNSICGGSSGKLYST